MGTLPKHQLETNGAMEGIVIGCSQAIKNLLGTKEELSCAGFTTDSANCGRLARVIQPCIIHREMEW
mgnify:CR=1 FL=1